MMQLILVLHVLVSIVLIGLVLIQQGKGADMGASFGGGASQTLFGSRGAGSFLSRMTAYAVTLFFITSLSLAYLGNKHYRYDSLVGHGSSAQKEAPTTTSHSEPIAPDVPVIP